MSELKIYDGGYTLVNLDESGCILDLIGHYPSFEEAQKQAEAYIIMMVEDSDYLQNRPYEILQDLGAGVKGDWHETEDEDILALPWNYVSPGYGNETILAIPMRHRENKDYTVYTNMNKKRGILDKCDCLAKETRLALKNMSTDDEKVAFLKNTQAKCEEILKDLFELRDDGIL